ncbi:MAG: DoxX family protein [Gammaproteobacteria bacterium]|nr:DoxX family protein [Gammaproteobacteria bacterium]
MNKLKIAGLAFVFLWFMGGGVMHFITPELFLAIMPPAVPYPEAIVAISGVFEILGALGLLLQRTRRMAGIGLFVLTLAVSPANIYMSLNPELFPDVSELALTIRLLIQVMLLACIWISSKSDVKSE